MICLCTYPLGPYRTLYDPPGPSRTLQDPLGPSTTLTLHILNTIISYVTLIYAEQLLILRPNLGCLESMGPIGTCGQEGCCVLHRRVMALVIFMSCAARISCLEWPRQIERWISTSTRRVSKMFQQLGGQSSSASHLQKPRIDNIMVIFPDNYLTTLEIFLRPTLQHTRASRSRQTLAEALVVYKMV